VFKSFTSFFFHAAVGRNCLAAGRNPRAKRVHENDKAAEARCVRTGCAVVPAAIKTRGFFAARRNSVREKTDATSPDQSGKPD
jgi:hypothetical protein